MKLYVFIIGFVFLAAISQAQSINEQDIFQIKQFDSEKQSLKGYVSLLIDSTGYLSIQQVSSLAYDTLFKKSSEWNTSFTVNPKSAIWVKITLENTTEESRWRIGSLLTYNNIAYYSPDGVHFYKGISGLNYKPSEKYFPYHTVANYSAPIFLTKRKQNIYIKTSSHFTERVALRKESIRSFLDRLYIIPEKQIEIVQSKETYVEVIFFGVCICMLLYNLFIYLFVRDRSYLYYSISIAGVVGYFIFLDGYYITVLFDVGRTRWERDLDDFMSAFSADISIFFFLSFSQIFLFANQKKVKWYKILHYLKWYLLIANVTFKVCLLLANTFAYEASKLFHNLNYGLVIIILIFLCINLWRNKGKVNLYYVYANLPFFMLIIVYIGYGQFHITRDTNFFLLDNSFQMGIMLQIISFSVALAARINFMRHEIEQKKLDNEQLNQRLLRTQMNPHFIFNSLTSIQNYLFENEPQKTAVYLSKFAKLMRQILESSREDFIPLEKEIQTLENYLQLQKMRFGDKLNYQIQVSPEINPEEVRIPPMFAQPFIENSLEHGILHRAEEGFIQIDFKQAGNMIVLAVEDNGVGLAQSKTLRSEIKKEYKSLATQITQERLSLLRQKYQLPLDFVMQELKNQLNEVAGTQVKVTLPMQN
jgi:sensor histidine kinase YesM